MENMHLKVFYNAIQWMYLSIRYCTSSVLLLYTAKAIHTTFDDFLIIHDKYKATWKELRRKSHILQRKQKLRPELKFRDIIEDKTAVRPISTTIRNPKSREEYQSDVLS
ncbi:hypothetical protein CDAR_37041 [Caerostris darwini]|uniref:Uncharacterized protein n=1 Tax=Caerostris darwini TaxID=1538125 RepID=A0AAV4TWB9_9ARAC|nr:hypothetical protein CDAR_37041 [Caerostris darwini]